MDKKQPIVAINENICQNNQQYYWFAPHFKQREIINEQQSN
jgi:hypothetical protein